MKKVLFFMLLTFFANSVRAGIVDSGNCNYRINWTLDDNGVLTLTGSGDMPNYSASYDNGTYSCDAPWYKYRMTIKEAIIGEGITSVGDYSFYNSGKEDTPLECVTFPNTLQRIGCAAFSDCHSLKTISIPESVSTIDYGAFLYCSSLTEVEIPNSVTQMNSLPSAGVFEGCKSLEKIVIGKGIKTIPKRAFYCCRKLTSVVFEGPIETIEEAAFYSCETLPSIELPVTLTSIGNNAFNCCIAFQSISIPKNVKSIASYAFANCTSLLKVYCHGTDMPSTISSIFGSTDLSKLSLYVPRTSITIYKSNDPWKKFGVIEEIPVIRVTSIEMSKNSITLPTDAMIQLVATVLPENAENKAYVWRSSNSEICSVSDGMVKALKSGYAEVSATASDGSGVSAVCKINVLDEKEVNCDINDDGKFDINDITTLVNMLLLKK